ncbi:glycosyltransferase [Mucilaginibacter sp. AK015]|uniref:glycosyltransferase n=1 Tax=Mucilaginibacter sp. AK015 TaxID=2723072 RepID=UPI0016145C17|nr:glycosyltransferase [Mucilaginibacter sp. AK015]
MPDSHYKLKIEKELAAVLPAHRERLVAKGVKLPLPTVPNPHEGLLAVLPRIYDKTGWPWQTEVDSGIYNTQVRWPKLTIVIPSYNQGMYIEEAIRSVLLQNYPSLELIVMDGGSNDNTKTILETYSPWISYWQSHPDGGQGQAINMGFSIAGGDYYGWLNSDDFYNFKGLFVLATAIIRSGRSFYYGDALQVNKNSVVQRYWKAYVVKDAFLRFGGLIASHSAFWKASANKPIWEAMNCNVDGELWIRLVKGQSKKHVRYPIGTVRLYSDSKSGDARWKDKWREDDMNIEKLHGKPPAARSVIYYFNRYIQMLYKSLSKPATVR